MSATDAADRAVTLAERLVDALAHVAPSAWHSLVLAERVDAITTIVVWAVAASAAVASLVLGLHIARKDDADVDAYAPPILFGCLAGLVCLCALLGGAGDTMQGLIAPEAAVLRDLAHTIGGAS